MRAVKKSKIAPTQTECDFQFDRQITVIGEEELIIANHHKIIQSVYAKYTLINKMLPVHKNVAEYLTVAMICPNCNCASLCKCWIPVVETGRHAVMPQL